MQARYVRLRLLAAGSMNEIRSDHTQSRWCWQTVAGRRASERYVNTQSLTASVSGCVFCTVHAWPSMRADIVKKVKVRIALYGEIRDRATERHLPYGITQSHTPATQHRWARPALTPAMMAGTRFTYPGAMEGWVDLVTRKHSRRESNSRPLGPESNALTTVPPST